MTNKKLINRRNIALKMEGEKKKKKVTKTRGIRIWSPIQVLTPQNRA